MPLPGSALHLWVAAAPFTEPWRARGPRLFGFGQARLWVLLAVLVLILVIALVNNRRGR